MKRVLVLALALAIAGSTAAPAFAARRPRLQTRTWSREGAAAYPVRRIALLPVFSTGPVPYLTLRNIGGEAVLRFLEEGAELMSPDLCADYMAAMGRGKRDSVVDAIRMQVLRRGKPDSIGIPRLSQVLRSQAILTVRVDRWERLIQNDQRTTTAYVEIVASLVDSTGRLLWQATGEDRQDARYGVPLDLPPPPSTSMSTTLNPGAGKYDPTGSFPLYPSERSSAPIPSYVEPMGYFAPTTLSRGGQGYARDFRLPFMRILSAWIAAFPLRPGLAALPPALPR